MIETQQASSRGRGILRWLVAAAFVLAVILSGLLSGLMNRAGLLYLVFGSVAAALMGFSGREIGAAIGHAVGRDGRPGDLGRSAYFWEAAARNAWVSAPWAAPSTSPSPWAARAAASRISAIG